MLNFDTMTNLHGVFGAWAYHRFNLDICDVNNYRPIALVTVASKIFEIILLDIFELSLQTSDNQFGFKKKHSTDHCLFVLKNVIDYYRSHGSPIYTCLLDASRAFDRVNHWNLFKKLINRGVPLIVVRILVYWYRTQTFCVKWGSVTSVFFNVSNGVRQGGILSPYLFVIYVDDLSALLNSSGVGCHINNSPINHIFYADDLCLMAPSPSGLQKLLDICVRFGLDNDIIYNTNKSMCMVFKPPSYSCKCPPMYLGNDTLDYVDRAKYLGVLLTANFKDDDDMMKHLRAFYIRSNTLIRKFYHCSIDIKLLLFRSYCTPSYCSHLWVNFNKVTYNKLRVAYNNVYRRILGYSRRDSASNMFVTNGIDNFDTLIRKNVYSFRSRVQSIKNSLVSDVYNLITLVRNNMFVKWMDILYIRNVP